MREYHAYPVDKYKKRLRIMLKPLFFTALFFPTLAMAQSYIVYDFTNNRMLETHQPNSVQPIASVTKLMTAIVFLEHNRNARCTTSITGEDIDHIKGTHTTLPKGTPIACHELLKAMLVHSDNYAAHALSRSAGMSRVQFIQKMNEKARTLGMTSTHFSDSSGLSTGNVSSALDLVKLAKYSLNKAEINYLSNLSSTHINTGKRRVFVKNTNKLVRDEIFSAAVNKTGYIRESGYNLVFVNGKQCQNGLIGVISLNNSSSENRARFTAASDVYKRQSLNNASSASRSNFTKNKLEKYGCTALNNKVLSDFVEDVQYEEGYDEGGMDALIKKVAE